MNLQIAYKKADINIGFFYKIAPGYLRFIFIT